LRAALLRTGGTRVMRCRFDPAGVCLRERAWPSVKASRLDMLVRNFAERTIDSYTYQFDRFARHFAKWPEDLGPEEIREFQLWLMVSAPTIMARHLLLCERPGTIFVLSVDPGRADAMRHTCLAANAAHLPVIHLAPPRDDGAYGSAAFAVSCGVETSTSLSRLTWASNQMHRVFLPNRCQLR
jgi:hypothetical protein